MALGDALSDVTRDRRSRCCRRQRVCCRSPEAATLGREFDAAWRSTFGFAIVIIFLVLAAQFESCAVVARSSCRRCRSGLPARSSRCIITGTSLNIYSQIGLVLLVGVMAKNGILIVEFANQLRDQGDGVRDAIERPARMRLRPVMMTMIATILGGVSAGLRARRRRRGARRARLGHCRRPRLGDAGDALSSPRSPIC